MLSTPNQFGEFYLGGVIENQVVTITIYQPTNPRAGRAMKEFHPIGQVRFKRDEI